MDEKVIVILENSLTGKKMDIEIPTDITVNELLYGLNEGLNLGINLEDSSECYLTMENPIALLKGNKELSEYGIRNGSIICVNR